MRRIECPRRPQQLRQRLDLGGRRVKRRGVEQPRGHPDRAGVERLLQPLGHQSDLVLARRPVMVGHRADPQRRVPDKAGGVDRGRLPVERGEVVGKARIQVIALFADQVERRRRALFQGQRREADAAIAGNHGRDALAGFRRHVRRREQRPVVMGVHVDKTGRDDFSGDIDLPRPGRSRDVAHRRDPVAVNCHVAAKARAAGPVDHAAAAQDQIGHPSPPPAVRPRIIGLPMFRRGPATRLYRIPQPKRIPADRPVVPIMPWGDLV